MGAGGDLESTDLGLGDGDHLAGGTVAIGPVAQEAMPFPRHLEDPLPLASTILLQEGMADQFEEEVVPP
jgi:hypothetical protein